MDVDSSHEDLRLDEQDALSDLAQMSRVSGEKLVWMAQIIPWLGDSTGWARGKTDDSKGGTDIPHDQANSIITYRVEHQIHP